MPHRLREREREPGPPTQRLLDSLRLAALAEVVSAVLEEFPWTLTEIA